MKLKKAKIIVQEISELKDEWKKALKGKKRSIQKKDEIIFTGLETLARIFSKNRIEILHIILNEKPNSIYALARLADRDFKNVYADVKFLSEIGLLELRETHDARNGLKPIAKFSGIEFDLVA